MARAWTKGGDVYDFDVSEYSRLRTDWMNGVAYFKGKTFHRSEVTIRLGEVVSVNLATPESIAEAEAEEAEDKKLNAIEGN